MNNFYRHKSIVVRAEKYRGNKADLSVEFRPYITEVTDNFGDHVYIETRNGVVGLSSDMWIVLQPDQTVDMYSVAAFHSLYEEN